ncbi:MAG: adenine methyltransferase [Chloroflexi bacterium]|nr:adenine methyltransferase [Chloroflexota bacterium]
MSAMGPVRKALSSSSEWETPAVLFDQVNAEFRFTFDAAASEENSKVARFVTVGEDALSWDPRGEVIWCNPPYGHLLAWVEAFERWAKRGNCIVVALLPANTDTVWFRKCWRACEIRFLSGRVNFVGSGGGNTGGSMLVIWRGLEWKPKPLVTLWDWRPEVSS